MNSQHQKCSNLILVMMVILAFLPGAVQAQEPAAMSPEQFILPWAKGQSFFITWGPYDHWAVGNLVGLSADFALPEGTSLYAPATGEASFHTDDRPYQYGLGNYIDLVCGPWKIRMAHLRDSQSGTRYVEQGEFLGYSGSSGASAPHLHLELLVMRDSQWVAAQESDLSSFFGVPFNNLVEGAVATSTSLTHQLAWSTEPTILTDTVQLGQDAEFLLPLTNLSELPVQFTLIQVALVAPDGSTRLAQIEGDWTVPPRGIVTITTLYTPEEPGLWRLRQATAVNAGQTWQLPLEGQWSVESSAIGVVGVAMSSTIEVGQRVPIELWLENLSAEELVFQHLSLIGQRPDGSDWQVEIDELTRIPANQIICLRLRSPYASDTGQWRITQLVERTDQHTFKLGEIEQSFTVTGPRLLIETLGLRGTRLLYVLIRNVGTRSARADWLEVYGSSTDGGVSIAARTYSVRTLAPGEAITLVLRLPEMSLAAPWSLIAGGYWLEGHYYTMPLPDPYLYDGASG
ncbi:MAG: peptidoglycan DD-metalloendopeptidase family protein [Anaerolineae bacterium]